MYILEPTGNLHDCMWYWHGRPAVEIALEKLAHMGADSFIRVGSCGVYQPNQKPGEVIIATDTNREGGTGSAYLPANFPAVPSYSIHNALAKSADQLMMPVTIGLGVTKDTFYGPPYPEIKKLNQETELVFVEMEMRYPLQSGTVSWMAHRCHFHC